MSYWVYVTLSCYNWKRNDFHYSGAYLFTSFVYCTNVYWSVIHGIKRKPHLSVVWNWYHFVAIAILHQPRPTDSADINTRLQLSDTSSIPPMHGGFLLLFGSGSTYDSLPLIARFMGPTRGPFRADRTPVGPMLAPWTLLSGPFIIQTSGICYCWQNLVNILNLQIRIC